MAGTPAGSQDEIETALRAIVAEHGPIALSNRAMMSNLLKDLMPDSPRVARMFVAAAEDRIADELLAHVAQGLDADTAARLAASSFAGATMYSSESCIWVTGEIAVALGLVIRPPGLSAAMPPTRPEPDGVAATGERAARGGGEPATNRVAHTRRLRASPLASSAVIATPGAPPEFPPDADDPAGPGPDDPPVSNFAGSVRRRLSRRNLWISAASAIAAAAAVVLVVMLGGPSPAIGYVISSNGGITPVNFSTGQVGRTVAVGQAANAIAITPDGKTAYLTDDADDSVVPIDLATGRPGQAISLGIAPVGLALAPDGTTAYALTSGVILPIALPIGQPLSPIQLRLPAGTIATSITIAADGKTAYLAAGHAVIPVDLATSQAGHPIEVSKDATVTAVAP